MESEGGSWHAIHRLREVTVAKSIKTFYSDLKIQLTTLHHRVLWFFTSLRPNHPTKIGDTQTQWDNSINTLFPQMQPGMKKCQTKSYLYFAQVAHTGTEQRQRECSFHSVRMNIRATIVARWKTCISYSMYLKKEKSNDKTLSIWQPTLRGFLNQRLWALI